MHVAGRKVWFKVTGGQEKMRRDNTMQEARPQRSARISSLYISGRQFSWLEYPGLWSLGTFCFLTILRLFATYHENIRALVPAKSSLFARNEVYMMMLRVKGAVRERAHVTLELIISWTNKHRL